MKQNTKWDNYNLEFSKEEKFRDKRKLRTKRRVTNYPSHSREILTRRRSYSIPSNAEGWFVTFAMLSIWAFGLIAWILDKFF